MKKPIILFLLIIMTNIGFGQIKQELLSKHDSIAKLYQKNHVYLDTLWVLDSSLRYQILNNANELTLQRSYKVLDRNDYGNKLVSLDWAHEDFPYTTVENSVYDSLIYFNGIDIKQQSSYVWNSVEQEWIYNLYAEYETDGLYQFIFNKRFSNSAQNYVFGSRYNYVNDDGKNMEIFSEDYIPETDTWQESLHRVYHYDQSGNDTLEIMYKWKDEGWGNYFTHHQYYESNLLVLSIYRRFIEETSTWQNFTKQYYSYTNLGQIDTIISKSWSTEENIWENYEKQIFSYDLNNRLTNRLTMRFINSTQQLENHRNLHIDYLDGNKVETFQNWELESGLWINTSRIFYSYIVDDILDTLQHNIWDTYYQSWETQDLSVNTFDSHMNLIENTYSLYDYPYWEINSRTYYYWSPFIPNSIKEIEKKGLLIYPNPASSYVSFKFEDERLNTSSNIKLQIFSITGQEIANLTMKHGKVTWDCSSTDSGVYLYRGLVDNKAYTGKIMVQ